MRPCSAWFVAASLPGCRARAPARPRPLTCRGCSSPCATPAARLLVGAQVPMGSADSGCASSGSDASEARKWRIRQASTPLMVAVCSTSPSRQLAAAAEAEGEGGAAGGTPPGEGAAEAAEPAPATAAATQAGRQAGGTKVTRGRGGSQAGAADAAAQAAPASPAAARLPCRRPPPPCLPLSACVASTGAMLQPRSNRVRTTAARLSLGRTATSGLGGCTPSATSSSRSALWVWVGVGGQVHEEAGKRGHGEAARALLPALGRTTVQPRPTAPAPPAALQTPTMQALPQPLPTLPPLRPPSRGRPDGAHQPHRPAAAAPRAASHPPLAPCPLAPLPTHPHTVSCASPSPARSWGWRWRRRRSAGAAACG